MKIVKYKEKYREDVQHSEKVDVDIIKNQRMQ